MKCIGEVKQRQVSYDITYTWNLKKKKRERQMNLFAKQNLPHRHRKTPMVTKGERGWGRINWEFGINRFTLLYIK